MSKFNGRSMIGIIRKIFDLPDSVLIEDTKETRRTLVKVISTLDQREIPILYLRQFCTLRAAGDVMGVTPERIRQLECKAYRKLMHPLRSRKLRSFVESSGGGTNKDLEK